MPDEPKKRWYWDSNVFITLISNLKTLEAERDREICRHILDDAIADKVEIFTASATLVEVRRREEDKDKLTGTVTVPMEARQKIRDLFGEPYITVIPVDSARAEEARELCWKYQLSTFDAIQVACAAFAKVELMQTYDGVKKPNGILRLDGLVGTPPLPIKVPRWEGQIKMEPPPPTTSPEGS